MTPQLKRAWASLIIGLIFFGIVVSIVISYDPINFLEDNSVKSLVYGIVVLGVALYGIMVWFSRSKEEGMSVLIDERDRTIGLNAMKYQVWMRSVVLLIWMIALIETYEYRQSIPLVFPFFIFITTIISGALAQSIGVIIGYARGSANA
jgi:uncharacterized RDD family membrane protein YckC